MDDDIPPLRPAGRQPPIRTPHDLFQYWRTLMGPLGFAKPRLWLTFITSGDVPIPQLTQVDALPRFPDRLLLTNLMMITRSLLEDDPGSSLAVLLSRPGRAELTASDLAWARGLTSAADDAGVRMRPVHLATDEAVRAFAPDDLIGPDAA